MSDIWNYTYEAWSEKQADKYYAILLDLCAAIAHKPQLGKRYDEVHAGLLGYRADHHIIFYRVISVKEIEIVRILHSRMDLRRRIAD